MALGIQVDRGGSAGVWNMRFFFVTSLDDPSQGDSLSKCHVRRRLTSFFIEREREGI